MKKLILAVLCLSTFASALDLSSTNPQKGTIYRWISLPASFAPWQQVDLKARVAGYIQKISVDKGDLVTAGQKLIEISVPELEADIIGHRAPITAAEIEVKRLHEARAKSPDLILPQAIDDAEAKLAIAKASMERASALLQFAQISAPFPGTITDRRVDPGAFTAAGGETMLQLTDVSTLRLQVPVVEIETAFLKVGQQIGAKVDALNGSIYKSTVTRITGALDPATRTMLIEADFKNEDGKLRPGMFATARIAVEQHDNATIIPVTGLVKEKTSNFVFKYINGQAIKTAIKPGFNDGVNVEVPELKADDVILLPGTITLTDKQTVNLVK